LDSNYTAGRGNCQHSGKQHQDSWLCALSWLQSCNDTSQLLNLV